MFGQKGRKGSPFAGQRRFEFFSGLRWGAAIWIAILPLLAFWVVPGRAEAGGKQNAAALSRLQATGTPSPTEAAPSATQGTPGKTPVVTSTAGADGSVVHIVQQGQTLWEIALAYGMSIADLMSLNGLDEKTVIYPGWKLVIHRTDRTPTGTPTETATQRPPPPTREPTRTPAPAATRTPVPVLAAGAAQTVTAQSAPDPVRIDVRRDPLLIIIGILVVAGTGLVLAGSLLKRGA